MQYIINNLLNLTVFIDNDWKILGCQSLFTMSESLLSVVIETVDYNPRSSNHQSQNSILVENCNACPHYGSPCQSSVILFGTEKLEWCGYVTVSKFYYMFSHFDRILACDGQTDRQTDRRTDRRTSCDSTVCAVKKIANVLIVKKLSSAR